MRRLTGNCMLTWPNRDAPTCSQNSGPALLSHSAAQHSRSGAGRDMIAPRVWLPTPAGMAGQRTPGDRHVDDEDARETTRDAGLKRTPAGTAGRQTSRDRAGDGGEVTGLSRDGFVEMALAGGSEAWRREQPAPSDHAGGDDSDVPADQTTTGRKQKRPRST